MIGDINVYYNEVCADTHQIPVIRISSYPLLGIQNVQNQKYFSSCKRTFLIDNYYELATLIPSAKWSQTHFSASWDTLSFLTT